MSLRPRPFGSCQAIGPSTNRPTGDAAGLAVSPVPQVVLAQSAVVRVRAKTTLRGGQAVGEGLVGGVVSQLAGCPVRYRGVCSPLSIAATVSVSLVGFSWLA
jgi:hypothetical protein